MARKLQVTRPTISRETREKLRRLLRAVPDDADASDRAFLDLLEAWEAAKIPYPASVIQAYRTRQGWLVGDVGKVIATIGREVG